MSLSASVLSGTGWMIALRWVNRLIGVVTVAVTARLLSPADFGLVAMATLIVGLTDVWMSWGLDNALVQSRDPSRELFDTAWTIRLLQGIVVAVLVAALAPMAAVYFREPRVEFVMWALAPGLALVGASNIGVVMYRKELNFRAEFGLQFGPRVLQALAGIAAAYLLLDYRALVIGLLTGYVSSFVMSYLYHPFRPRWSLRAWRQLWSFSSWTLVGNLGYFAETKADEFIVGRIGTAKDMGLYSVATDLGQSASFELAAPISRVLFPAFSKMQGDGERLAASFVRAYEGLAMIIVPAGVGLALVANEVVSLVLGPKWGDAVPLVVILSIYGVVRSGITPISSLLMATGRIKLLALLAWFGFALFVAASLALGPQFGIVGIAWSKVVGALLTTAISMWFLRRAMPIRLRLLLVPLARIGIAVTVMALAVTALIDLPISTVAALAVKVSVGAIAFAAVMLLMWLGRGRPDGFERTVLELIAGRLRRA